MVLSVAGFKTIGNSRTDQARILYYQSRCGYLRRALVGRASAWSYRGRFITGPIQQRLAHSARLAKPTNHLAIIACPSLEETTYTRRTLPSLPSIIGAQRRTIVDPNGQATAYIYEKCTGPHTNPETIMIQHGFARNADHFQLWVQGLSHKYNIVRCDLRGHA